MWLNKFLRPKAVSPLSYVLMRSSYNFGELISFLRVHMPPMLVGCSPSNGGSLLLVSTTLVGSGGVDVSLWVGEDF